MKTLKDYGITRRQDGSVHTDGREVHVPTALLWFGLDFAVEVVHLPGSADGYPQEFGEADFISYVSDMADDGSDHSTLDHDTQRAESGYCD
jgi:hypothetical protein